MNNKFKSKKPLTLNQRNFNRLLGMKGDYSGQVVSFRYHDQTIKKMEINDKFCKDEKGKTLRVGQIIQNLNAISHDAGARDYKI